MNLCRPQAAGLGAWAQLAWPLEPGCQMCLVLRGLNGAIYELDVIIEMCSCDIGNV
jgi:hypothetical protein